MARGPEANFWNMIRKNLPPKSSATRIENSHGGGVPDVHVVWDGLPFWVELKVAKYNAVGLRPNQVAWHMSYSYGGGVSFILVKRQKKPSLLLFDGDSAPRLHTEGIACGLAVEFCDSASLFKALRPRLVNHYAGFCAPAPLRS